MAQKLIEGVRVQRLSNILDERGSITEIFTENQGDFWRPPRHVYISRVHEGVTKAWHFHKVQEDAFTCVHGKLKLAMFDCRPGSPTEGLVNVFFLSPEAPITVRLPPGVLHGFKGIEGGGGTCIVVNNCSHPYRYDVPDEFRVHPHDPVEQAKDFAKLGLSYERVPYDWARQDG